MVCLAKNRVTNSVLELILCIMKMNTTKLFIFILEVFGCLSFHFHELVL